MPTWKSSTVTGLYLNTATGSYYSRYSLHGKRAFRSLKTSSFSSAKIMHAKLSGEIEKARLGDGAASTDVVRSMGDLRAVFLSRLATSKQNEKTKINWGVWMKRLVAHWPVEFDPSHPNSVTMTFILRMRERLLKAGYAPAVVNQTFMPLQLMLQIAKEYHLIFSSPFDDQTAFGARIWLPKRTRKPDLPPRFDMEQVFDALGRLHGTESFEAGRVTFLQGQALDAAEHARFLAFSGCRLNEGNRMRWEDVGATSIMVRGTKSATSHRPVPIVPAMRSLLDEMIARRRALNQPCRGPILRVKGCRDALKRACSRVGLKRGLHHHDLRHYFVTVCIESGVDIPTVARWLGHADGGALLMKTYAHLRDAHAARMGAQVDFSSPSASPSTDSGSVSHG